MALARLNGAQSAYLDIVRAAAAMTVMLGHAIDIYMKDSPLAGVHMAKLGVPMFFLLSGFLISHSVLVKIDRGPYRFGDYFLDRFCRIFCAFVPALVLVTILDFFSLRLLSSCTPEAISGMHASVRDIGTHYTVGAWLGNLFMLQSSPILGVIAWLDLPIGDAFWAFGSAAPFWTISIEWWIYMAFGCVVFFVLPGRKPSFLWTGFFLFAFITPGYFLVSGSAECLTGLWIVGTVAAVLFCQHSGRPAGADRAGPGRTRRHLYLMCAGFFALTVGFRVVSIVHHPDRLDTFPDLQFSLLLAGVLFSALLYVGTFQRVPLWFARGAGFLAAYSYSLYLLHATVMAFCSLAFPWGGNDYGGMALAIVAANLVAIGFWWLFERHYHAAADLLKARLRDGRLRPITAAVGWGGTQWPGGKERRER